MELRQLAYFVAVSEELNFGRAAEREHIAPTAFSEQIQRLERELGVLLMRRTTRSVALTDAGRTLLPLAREALASVESVRTTAARLARGEQGILRVGLAAAVVEVTSGVLAEYGRRRPEIDLKVHEGTFGDPSAGLVTGDVDVALVWGPYASDGQRMRVLRTEPRLAVLPADHPLAAGQEIPAQALLDEVWCDVPSRDAVWRAFWLLDELRGGVPARMGGVASSPAGVVELIAAGQGIALLPRALTGAVGAFGLRAVPVPGIAPCQIAVALPAEPGPAALAFADVAADVAGAIARD